MVFTAAFATDILLSHADSTSGMSLLHRIVAARSSHVWPCLIRPFQISYFYTLDRYIPVLSVILVLLFFRLGLE